MNPGLEFERELSEEFGLERIRGSGSVWHNKLDLRGHEFRWSLKSTGRERHWPISIIDMTRDIGQCLGPGGDGSSPIWAARIPLGDFILMRKEDFKLMQQGDIKLIDEDRPQVAARKERAKQPELLRDLDLEGLPLNSEKGKIS